MASLSSQFLTTPSADHVAPCFPWRKKPNATRDSTCGSLNLHLSTSPVAVLILICCVGLSILLYFGESCLVFVFSVHSLGTRPCSLLGRCDSISFHPRKASFITSAPAIHSSFKGSKLSAAFLHPAAERRIKQGIIMQIRQYQVYLIIIKKKTV